MLTPGQYKQKNLVINYSLCFEILANLLPLFSLWRRISQPRCLWVHCCCHCLVPLSTVAPHPCHGWGWAERPFRSLPNQTSTWFLWHLNTVGGSKFSSTGVPVPYSFTYKTLPLCFWNILSKEAETKELPSFLLRQHTAPQLNYTPVSIGYMRRPTTLFHSRIFRLPFPLGFSWGWFQPRRVHTWVTSVTKLWSLSLSNNRPKGPDGAWCQGTHFHLIFLPPSLIMSCPRPRRRFPSGSSGPPAPAPSGARGTSPAAALIPGPKRY